MINHETKENTNDVNEVENNYWYNLHLALARLEENKDFQLVVEEAYFKDRAVNGVSMLANDNVKRNGFRGDIMEEMVAISHFRHFLLNIHSLGAPAPLDDEEDALEV
jgi:hypothetical protein